MEYLEVEPGLLRGPRIAGFLNLYHLAKVEGVKTVLNLQIGVREALLGELDNEPSWCREFGVRFLDMDFWGFMPPSTEKLLEAVEYLADPALRPLYVHCRHGKERTGLVVAAYNVIKRGKGLEDEFLNMINLGCRFPYSFFAYGALLKATQK